MRRKLWTRKVKRWNTKRVVVDNLWIKSVWRSDFFTKDYSVNWLVKEG